MYKYENFQGEGVGDDIELDIDQSADVTDDIKLNEQENEQVCYVN